MTRHIESNHLLLWLTLISFVTSEISTQMLIKPAKQWTANFYPNVVETETTVAKAFIAVNVSKWISNQLIIKASCQIKLKHEQIALCHEENSQLLSGMSLDNETMWRINKQPTLFKGSEMHQLVVTRVAPSDALLVESGIIRCCLVELEDADNFEIIDASFFAKMTPNLLFDWSKSRSEVAEEKWTQKWHPKWPLLAVVYDNSPYLGHIYPQPTSSIDLKSYSSSSSFSASSNYEAYSYGKPITTIDRAQLQLPSPIFKGKCAQLSAVQFLISRTANCNYLITPSVCSSLRSNLNIENYLNDNINISSDGYDNNAVSNVTVNVSRDKNGSDDQLRFNAFSNLCENVVSYVKYTFQWNGHSVTSINVVITLSDVKINSYISAHYVTEFVHDNVYNNTEKLNESLLHRRSGNPGYVMGENLLTFKSELNQSRFSRDYSLKLPKTDGDGNCKAGSGEQIKFGQDIVTGCKLKITDCDDFKNEVQNWVCEKLLHADYVSTSGNPQLNSSQHFTEIFKDENIICNLNYELRNSTCNMAVSPAIWLTVIVVYAHSGHQGQQLQFFSVQGLQIRSNSNFLHCSNTCNMTSSVEVAMSVEFVEVQNTTSQDKKFWLKQKSLPCSQDKCWAEFNYPLTQGHSTITFEQLSSFYQHIVILVFSAIIFIWATNQSYQLLSS